MSDESNGSCPTSRIAEAAGCRPISRQTVSGSPPGSRTFQLTELLRHPEHIRDNRCRLLRTGKRACRYQVKLNFLCCDPVRDCEDLVAPFFCQLPVCIARARPGIFGLPVPQDENVHTGTIARGRDKYCEKSAL